MLCFQGNLLRGASSPQVDNSNQLAHCRTSARKKRVHMNRCDEATGITQRLNAVSSLSAFSESAGITTHFTWYDIAQPKPC